MMEILRSHSLRLSAGAAAALLTVGLVPVAAAPMSHRPIDVSASIVLTSNEATESIAELAQAADITGSAEAFDISGLLAAEVAAAQGLFNSLISLPGTLINDFENVINDLTAANFGMAFSDLIAIPRDIVNYVLGIPGSIGNTLYEMVAVLPGEYLLNFG